MAQSSSAASSASQTAWMAVILLYGTALLQGLTMVSFPASGAVLKDAIGLTDAQYGTIFLPQVGLAVVGSLGGGLLARRWGLKPLLVITLITNALSQGLLAGSVTVAPALAFPAVLFATASLGLAFGIGGAPLNSYPPLFFPDTSDTAVVALHSLLGVGLAVGPLIMAPFVSANLWIGFPILLFALAVLLLLGTVGLSFPTDDTSSEGPSTARPVREPLFWAFVVAAVMYAFAEGTFSNWAVLYLHEGQGVPQATAGLALSVFWGALVVGRLLTSALVTRVSSQTVWVVLPLLMIAAFLTLPVVNGAAGGIAAFGLAGLGCSSFFPLTITLISRAFPEHVAWSSSMMIAALMVGVGAGTFLFGPLREMFSFATLYRLSVLYPVVALIAAGVVVRSEPCKQSIREMWTGSRCT